MQGPLKALFRYVKNMDNDRSWVAIRDNVLAQIYHPNMRFVDVIKVLLTAYTEALMEPRFELPGRHNVSEELLLAPIKGHHSIELGGPSSVEQKYSVEQFYSAMIDK